MAGSHGTHLRGGPLPSGVAAGAVIEPDVHLAEDVVVGAGALVGAGAWLGPGTVVEPGAHVPAGEIVLGWQVTPDAFPPAPAPVEPLSGRDEVAVERLIAERLQELVGVGCELCDVIEGESGCGGVRPADLVRAAEDLVFALREAGFELCRRRRRSPAKRCVAEGPVPPGVRGVLVVRAQRLARGLVRVWPWAAAVGELRASCPQCGPLAECLVHDRHGIELVDADGSGRPPGFVCILCEGRSGMPAWAELEHPTHGNGPTCQECLEALELELEAPSWTWRDGQAGEGRGAASKRP